MQLLFSIKNKFNHFDHYQIWLNGLITFLLQIGSQVIRLLSNIIFSFLLLPSDFGVMAIVNIWVIGIQLLSDLGLAPALQRSHKCHDLHFQQTAWSLQVLRGVVLFIITVLCSQFMEDFYQIENLSLYLNICSLGILISSFASVEIHIHPKKTLFKKIAFFELKSQIIGTLFGLFFCTIYPSMCCTTIYGHF